MTHDLRNVTSGWTRFQLHQNHARIQNVRRSSWKISMLGKSEYLFVVQWHGRSCQEMCGAILWVSEQDDSTTPQSIDSMYRWPSLQRRRNEICWRIVTFMLSNCSNMLIFSKNWTTRYFMVSEQTCTIDYKMDQSLWQTTISFDLLHSSHNLVQTVLNCGNTAKQCRLGLSRLRSCRRSWGLEIYFRWNIVHFRTPHVRSNQVDV